MSMPPEPDFSAPVDKLVGYYKRAMEMLVAKLNGADPAHLLTTAKRTALLREIADILQSLDEHASDWINEHVPSAYLDGQATALVGIGRASTVAKAVDIVSTLGIVNEAMVKSIVADTHADLLAATDKVREEAKRVVRDIVAEHTRMAAITSEKAKNVAKQAAVDLARVQAPIIDRAGRRWDLRTYAETVVKTKLSQAHREGAIEQAVVDGFDIGRISAHGATDACSHFEGALVSLTGATHGYPTVAQLKSSGLVFHPRCRHLVLPVNPKLLPQSVQQHADEMAPKAAEALRLADEGKMNSHGMKKGA